MTADWQPSKWPPAAKRYMREFPLASALYVGVLIGSVVILRRFDPPLYAAIPLALAPVAPALLMLRAYLRFVAGVDEMQRRIQHESMLIAAAVVAFGTFSYGFLEGVGAVPSIPGALIWVLPAMIAVWGVTLPFVIRRYK
jgi:hypothetical protein